MNPIYVYDPFALIDDACQNTIAQHAAGTIFMEVLGKKLSDGAGFFDSGVTYLWQESPLPAGGEDTDHANPHL